MKKITITEKILRRPVTAFMMSLMVIGFGIFSLSNLKVTLYPSFNIPVMGVSVNYANVAPDDMLRLVVEPIESVIMGVEGVESLDSNVRTGGAFLILRLKPGTNIMVTEQKVREAVERIRPQLPAEANEPFIFQFDPDRAPVMRVSVESDVLGLDELRRLSIEYIEPRFERIPGVASAETQGGLTRNIYVDLLPEALARHNLMPSQVVNAIRNNNVQQPVGSLIADRTSFSIRAESMYKNVEEIAQTVITSENNAPVRVRDVAIVRDDFEEITSVVEINGRNSVTVDIQKQSDANTLDVTHQIIQTMDEFRPNLPSSVVMQVLSNEGQFIEDSVSNLAQSALIALIVVVLILLLFMGGWRIAFIVAMSIPVSLTATFAVMYALDITLNIMSITGLALAIGLLVDNSIVVSESIANQFEKGTKSRFQAALDGTNEVGGALLGSTMTTIGVFIPMLTLTGFAGVVARDLALTISIAIGFSFLASIVLIPVLASLMLNSEQFQSKNYTLSWIKSLENNYINILEWILARKYVVAIGIVGIIFGANYLFGTIPKEFFPETDEGQFDLRVELPAGTNLATTATLLREYTQLILEDSDVQTVITNIGRRGRSTITNGGTLSISLVDDRYRESVTADVAARLQESLREPDVNVEIANLGGSGGIPTGRGWAGRGIRVSLVGADMEVLQTLSLQIEEALLNDPAVLSVSNPRSRPAPELAFELDRNRISRAGISSMNIASELGTQARGTRAGFFRDEGREIAIQVRNVREQFQNRDDLFSLELAQVDDQRIPVFGLGNFNLVETRSNITRRDRETLLDVSVMIRGDIEAYQTRLEELLQNEIFFPDGYRYEFGGSVFAQQESGAEVLIAILLALLLTYMVMASLFENLRDPFIVMFSVPLAFFGSLLFLWLTSTPLSIPAYIGIVILIGIVVNNGIVLVDFIHQNTRGKEDRQDYLILFLMACKRRMRPILLTAMTTICSMIPLALELGAGSETWSPLARSVIGGLAFATILTLFVVPSVAIGISKKRRKVIKKALSA